MLAVSWPSRWDRTWTAGPLWEPSKWWAVRKSPTLPACYWSAGIASHYCIIITASFTNFYRWRWKVICHNKVDPLYHDTTGRYICIHCSSFFLFLYICTQSVYALLMWGKKDIFYLLIYWSCALFRTDLAPLRFYSELWKGKVLKCVWRKTRSWSH